MALLTKYQRTIEQARKKQVEAYKKSIADMEEDSKLFYENELKRSKISAEDYATILKERSERYAQHAQDVLGVSYMTEQERYDLSREYMQKSEDALTEHIERIKKLEREKLNAAMENSVNYVSDRNYYSSWEEVGDDPINAFGRVDKRLSEAVMQGDISYKEYYDRLSGFGSAMYKDRIANSNRWLEHEREMNQISSEDYIAGLYRMRTYTQEFYSAGIISHREYIDGLQSLDERIFEERKNQHKEILRQAEKEKRAIDENAQARIDTLQKQYKAAISDIDEDNLDDELAYLTAQERIYGNAQTREGKERLAEIREDIEDINEEKRRIALKEDLEARTENILNAADYRKSVIDRDAARTAIDLGLYYDEDTGYKMMRHVTTALGDVLGKQKSFSQKSSAEIDSFNSGLTNSMASAYETFSSGILANFQSFADGVTAIKEKIFADVESVNSLNFSRFGSSGGKTTITYNDYGDKKISSSTSGTKVLDTFKNLIAKGLGL